MTPARSRTVRLAALIAGGLVMALAGVPAASGSSVVDDDVHADHAPPGNPITAPLASNVTLVDSDAGMTGGHVAAQGDRLYVGAYGAGMRIFSVADPANPRLIGEYLPGGRADAVPDAAVFGKRHLAVLNGTRRVTGPVSEIRTDRSEFLDVTDPARPKLLWTFVGPDDGEAHNGDIVDNRKLWLPSGGTGTNGLRIYDLRPLLAKRPSAPANILRANPVDLWAASPYRAGRPVGPAFTHTHDITVYTDHPVTRADGSVARRDIALVAEGGSYTNEAGNTGSVFVIDVTDPKRPVALLRYIHQTGPGHHPIRYNHEAQLLDGDRQVMLITDEDLHHPCGEGIDTGVDNAGGGVVAVRLTPQLTDATELSEWFIPLGTPAPVCSVHVMSSLGDNAFFGAYNAGLQVVDYSDPANPVQAGQYIAPGTTAWGALAYRGYVYVGDVSRGLDTFRFTG